MSAKSRGAALGAVLAGCFFSAPANASTITDNFSFLDDLGAVVANGSFSYDSSHSGLLGYGDLSAFTINLIAAGSSYDLAFVNSVSNYVYFGYDTVTNSFVPASIAGDFGSFDGILSAINDLRTTGFFITTVPGTLRDYATPIDANVAKYTVAQTPIPAALPLFASALCGLGFVACRRRRSAAITVSRQ
jgi:hypothetical protein